MELYFGHVMVLPPFGSPLREKLAHAALILSASTCAFAILLLSIFVGRFCWSLFGAEDDFAARRASIRNWQEPFAIIAWWW